MKINNTKLEKIIKKEITPQTQKEFIETLKKSQLYMPVIYNTNIIKEIEKTKPGDIIEPQEQISFDINYLQYDEKNKAIPLFTSNEIIESINLKSSTIAIYMSDLAEMLKQTDKYALITINPLTEYDINMSIETFLNIFKEPTKEEKEFLNYLNEVLNSLTQHSIELEENTTLFIKDNTNFMVENATDGIFTPNIPFYASTNPEYEEHLKYTNILLMPKSKKILPIKTDNDLNIIIAPGTQFKLQDTMDGTQNLWMCGEQPFYDEKG